MKRFIQIVSITFCMLNVSDSLAQLNFNWVRNIGSSIGEYPEAITTDVNGNVYSTGSFDGGVDMDPGAGFAPVNSAGSFDTYISKLDANGNYVWGKSLGSFVNDVGHAIAVDASGNAYITGYFTGTVDFDTGTGTYTMTSAGGSPDIYILKLDANGNFVWAVQFGAGGNDDSNSLALDNSGNVYTTGFFNNTVDFDPGVGTYTLASAGSGDIFVSKLDANGNFVWAKQIGSVNNEVAYAITVDAAQNVYTTGNFFMNADFDPGPGVFNISIPGNGCFISKLDVNGDFVWAKAFDGTSSIGRCIKTDAANNVYTTGYFQSIVDFDPGAGSYTLAPASLSPDAFVSKLDPSGNFLWANAMGSTSSDYGVSLSLDASQNVYTTGVFEGIVDFDSGAGTYTLSSAGSQDIYISKLNSGGGFVWAYKLGGMNNDQGSAISVDASDNIYLTGYFSDSPDLDPTASTYTLAPFGSGDIFILKLNQCVAPAAPANTTPTVNLLICQGNTTTLTATGSGTLTWYATASSTTTLGSGTSFITPTLTAGTYTYYVENATCTLSATRTLVSFTVSTCTGINSIMQEQLAVKLYPNPTSGIVNIELEIKNNDDVKIQVVNCIGQVLISETINNQHSSFNIQHFPAGIYFLTLKTKNNSVTRKIIKE